MHISLVTSVVKMMLMKKASIVSIVASVEINKTAAHSNYSNVECVDVANDFAE